MASGRGKSSTTFKGEPHKMKKLMTLAMALSFLAGSVAFADDAATTATKATKATKAKATKAAKTKATTATDAKKTS